MYSGTNITQLTNKKNVVVGSTRVIALNGLQICLHNTVKDNAATNISNDRSFSNI